jgi:cytochrome c2/glucose/arabinose dehydrogenase
MLPRPLFVLSALVFFLLPQPARPADLALYSKQSSTNWSNFVESDFPFFSSVLDARNLGEGWPTNNLTPRGLILNLGNDCWACFDTELLRMSVIWQGKGVTRASMAQGSYQLPGHKAAEGQNKLPQIIGQPWIASGIYPGWQAGEQPALTDPREPGPDPREIGRGALPEPMGRFQVVRLTDSVVCLKYEVRGVSVREWVESEIADGQPQVQRRFHLESVHQPLWLLLGHLRPGLKASLATNQIPPKSSVVASQDSNGLTQVRIEPSANAIEFDVAIGVNPQLKELGGAKAASAGPPARVRWPQTVITKTKLSQAEDAYVVDDVALPLENPWRRNVRLADLAFLPDGRAAGVTFDGDVWLITGLAGKTGDVRWRRFASGFHEPLSLCIRDGSIFIFDRNGIWRLRDTDGNGEADAHELFSNAFAQTAETREFANGMRLAPDGSFIIAKGGQQSSTLGKLNGTVLQVASDGMTYQVLGWGLRQPFIGVHPRTGLITASDQQGHYVPATPLQIIRNHQYYGFLAGSLPKEKYPAPIADPLVWIPHPVNASGAGQVWLTGANMGPLNEALIHIGYGRPELFLVRLNSHGSTRQAAVVSLTQNLEFAPLNGAVNPADGQLYVAGFQIWGTTARRTSGLARVRYTGAPNSLPREVAAMDKGILLRFDVALAAKKAADPSNFSVERWNYKRTSSYGSPHFKLDGSTGQEWMTPSSAYVSQDGKTVFIGIRDMQRVMQMRVSWTLATEAGRAFEETAYLTPYELTRFDPVKEGFEPVAVDLTPRTSKAASTPVTVEEGQKLASLMGCTACHSIDGSTAGKVGPTWKGLFGAQREFKDGEPAVADAAYLHESILDPAAKIVQGFEKNDAGMPSYAGVLTEPQIQALILYIQTLK